MVKRFLSSATRAQGRAPPPKVASERHKPRFLLLATRVVARSPIPSFILDRLLNRDGLNFLLTNRLPRRWLTRFVGRISKSEHPWVCSAAMRLWRTFSDLDLSDAKETQFKSVHACFTRELKAGARPIDRDPAHIVSPCDGILGACGRITAGTLLQAKGREYTLAELVGSYQLAARYQAGTYLTLRLTSSMYHRFHAPHDCRIRRVTYFPGDMWNVNPPALRRIDRLFCKNERAVLQLRIPSLPQPLLLVPVAAILVGSIRLHFLNLTLNMRYRGPNVHDCDAAFTKGDEIGWFEHGSTIIVIAPPGISRAESVRPGTRLQMGEPLLTLSTHRAPSMPAFGYSGMPND